MESQQFEKTPRKANRWFAAFIVLSVLYGITFALWGIFNWIFFLTAAYCFFMSYYLLPVQPRIFQERPRHSGGAQFNPGQRSSQTVSTSGAPSDRVKKIIIGVGAVMFGLFLIPFVIGFMKGWNGEDQGQTTEPDEQISSYQAADNSAASLSGKGNDFFNNQQYDSADIYYERALVVDGGYGEAIYGKGIVAYQQDRKEDATSYFLRAYEGGYRYAWLSWVLADMYDKQGQTSRATDLYKESVNLDSTYVDSYTRLAELEPAQRDKYLRLAQKYKSN